MTVLFLIHLLHRGTLMSYPWKNKKTLCFCISFLLLLSTIMLLPTTQANTPSPANFSIKWSVNLDSYFPIGWGPNPTDYCYSSNFISMQAGCYP